MKTNRRTLWISIRQSPLLYMLLIPGLLHLIIFKYLPMFGIVIAFQDYSPFLGFTGSKWVGLKHFHTFLSDPYFVVLLKNTLLLSSYNLFFSFPVPILFALFVNEVRLKLLKRWVQTLSFFPYFISSAVTVGIMYTFLTPQGGLINLILNYFGLESVYFMAEPGYFRSLYVLSNIWHTFGYGAVVYLAAITGIDPHLYEAADIDGASRWTKMFSITLPSITNIIFVMLIIQLGNIFTVDLDKVLLMYNPAIYDTADIIQTFVYRQAFGGGGFPQYSYGAAVNLFQSVIALLFVATANKVAKKYSDNRLF